MCVVFIINNCIPIYNSISACYINNFVYNHFFYSITSYIIILYCYCLIQLQVTIHVYSLHQMACVSLYYSLIYTAGQYLIQLKLVFHLYMWNPYIADTIGEVCFGHYRGGYCLYDFNPDLSFWSL